MKPRIPAPAPILTAVICLLIAPLVLFEASAVPAASQADSISRSWPESLSNTPQHPELLAIVADSLGYVHVFWDEDVGGEPLQQDSVHPVTDYSILHTRWDGHTWTSPIEILFVTGETNAALALDVDQDDCLHLAWTGQPGFCDSHAPAWQAASAYAWSEQAVAGGSGMQGDCRVCA